MTNMSEGKIPFSQIKSKPSFFNLFRVNATHGLTVGYDSIRRSITEYISSAEKDISNTHKNTSSSSLDSGLSQLTILNPVTNQKAAEMNTKQNFSSLANGISIPELLNAQNKSATNFSLHALIASHLNTFKHKKNKINANSADDIDDNFNEHDNLESDQVISFIEDKIKRSDQVKPMNSLNDFLNLNNEKNKNRSSFQHYKNYANKINDFFQTLRLLLGPAEQLDQSLSTQNSIELTSKDAVSKPTTEDLLNSFNKWWETTGENLPLDILTSFYISLENAPQALRDITSHQSDYVTINAIQQYHSTIKKRLFGKYQNNPQIDINRFSKTQLQKLKQNGILSLTNILTKKFNYDDIHQTLSKDYSPEENYELHHKIRNSYHAQDSFERIDITNKQSIKMISPNGHQYTLDSLLNNALKISDNVDDTLSSLTEVYTVLLDQITTMTGLSENTLVSKKPIVHSTPNGQYEMTIYPKGEWQALVDNTGKLPGYVKKTNEPITLTFNSKKAAYQYFEHILAITTALSDCLAPHFHRTAKSTYYLNSQKKTSGLRLLTVKGNQLSLNYPFNTNCVESEEFSAVLSQLGKKVQFKTTLQVMSNNIFNMTTTSEHKLKKEKYNKEKQDHDDAEDERIKQEQKEKQRNKKQIKEQERKSLLKEKERRAKLKKQALAAHKKENK